MVETQNNYISGDDITSNNPEERAAIYPICPHILYMVFATVKYNFFQGNYQQGGGGIIHRKNFSYGGSFFWGNFTQGDFSKFIFFCFLTSYLAGQFYIWRKHSRATVLGNFSTGDFFGRNFSQGELSMGMVLALFKKINPKRTVVV